MKLHQSSIDVSASIVSGAVEIMTVAEWSRRTYPAPLGAGGVGSIPANSDAQTVPLFRRWRFEMKLSPFLVQSVFKISPPIFGPLLITEMPGGSSIQNPFIDVFYHQSSERHPGHTARAPPFTRGGRVRPGDQTTASPTPWPLGHDNTVFKVFVHFVFYNFYSTVTPFSHTIPNSNAPFWTVSTLIFACRNRIFIQILPPKH
jgi:hypothetical protein